jgi:hypothetical protein
MLRITTSAVFVAAATIGMGGNANACGIGGGTTG